MRFLIHGKALSTAVGQALVRHGHCVVETEKLEVNLEHFRDVLDAAHSRQFEIITADGALATAPFMLKYFYKRVLVHLQLDGGDVEQDDAIDRLFTRYKRLTPGRLYTVTNTRVKVRQLPA